MASSSISNKNHDNEDQMFFSLIKEDFERLQEALFEKSDSENKKIKKDIDSENLQKTIDKIKEHIGGIKFQYGFLNTMNEQLQKQQGQLQKQLAQKNSSTYAFSLADHKTSSSSSSSDPSSSSSPLETYEKIVLDIESLKNSLIVTFFSSSLTQLELGVLIKRIEKIKNGVFSQFEALTKKPLVFPGPVSNNHKKETQSDSELPSLKTESIVSPKESLKIAHDLLTEKLQNPKHISGNYKKATQSDSSLPGLSENIRSFTPEYVRGLRDQNIDLAMELTKARREVSKLKNTVYEDKIAELEEDNELLAQELLDATNEIVDLREKLESYLPEDQEEDSD